MSRAHRRFAKYLVYTIAFLLAAKAFAQERRPVDTPPSSRVLGRVVDADLKPLAGVRVVLHAVDGPWAPGVETHEFETRTTADGAFALDVRTPTADWVSLFVEPDPYHDIADRDFGPAGGRDQPRMAEGDNELGTFTLASTGAIAGSVLGPDGAPVTQAEVRLSQSFPGGMGRGTTSDELGHFLVGHVPAGEYSLEVLARGFLRATTSPLAVATGKTTEGTVVTLVAGPTISGVVVDEQGSPVANARVWGWPHVSGVGSGAGARTDELGRFVVPLKHDAPHTLEVEAAGFAKLEEARGRPHASGATDVRLVLARPVMTTFVVLDAATSQPLGRFALVLNWKPHDGGSRSGGEPKYALAERPEGELTCEADPAKHVYLITSPGYAPAEGEIVFDSPATRRCVVRLGPEGALRGRVLLGGTPLARAEIKLYAASLLRYDEDVEGGAAPFDEQSYFWSDWEGQQDLVFVLPRPTTHRTESDGGFALTGLAQNEYRIEINGPGGARVSLDPVAVFEGEPVDLGDIELVPGASLAGTVILPSGIDPTSVKLHCYSWDRRVLTGVSPDRSFLFEGVPAGTAHVGVSEALGLVTWGAHPVVELRPGQTSQMTFDLSARASVATSVQVLVNGKPAEGVRVYLESATEKRFDRLGDTDANGRAQRSVLALGPTNVTLLSQSGVRLGTFERALDISVGTTPQATIDVPCGAIEVEWPALREDEPLYLVQLGAFLDSEEHRMWPHAMPDFDAPRYDARIVGPMRARFAWIPPGDVEWTIEVQTVEGNEVQRNHVFRRRLSVQAGETTECLLTDADRVD